MIKEIGIKKEGEVIEYYGITLADDMVGQGLKKDEDGVISVDVESLDINEEKLVKITWAELKALRDEAKLVAGTFYRITDYVTTTIQQETKSANHPFDVIVLALSENTLCEDAKAILHEGDTYFAESDLSTWELKYCLDNDKTRFEWADVTNGKGVIYRMVDEKRNDCPYDFKNILFYNTKLTSDKYYYTFSYVVSDVLYDGTTEKQVRHCYGNVMGEYHNSGVLQLNKNVFRNTSFGDNCYSNTFGDNCYYNTFGSNFSSNTFGDNCYYNTFGDRCYSNTFGSNFSSNTFGDNCYSNTFGDNCYSNTFGDRCYSNTFGYSCYSNTFGYSCYYNTFGDNCYSNTFGDNCFSNTFGYSCYYNTFGDRCYSNTFGDNCYYNTFGDNCYSNTFGYSCNYNTFGKGLNNRSLDSDKTSITLNKEFYDDGSGQLVPTKHPDLSTQPSILPYKFMGQYVYEILLPIPDIDLSKSKYEVNASKLLEYVKDLYAVTILQAEELLFCHRKTSNYPNIPMFVHRNVSIYTSEQYGGTAYYNLVIRPDKTDISLERDGVVNAYLRIVYTSIPKEGGDYYGYNEY